MGDYWDRFREKMGPLVLSGEGYVAHCPCPDHGADGEDHRPSLAITIGEEGVIACICRVGCDTENVLKSVGLTFQNLYPGPGEAPREPLNAHHNPLGLIDDDDADRRHRIYTAFLEECYVQPWIFRDMQARGFLDRYTRKIGVCPVPSDDAFLQQIYEQEGDQIWSVPGIVSDEHDQPRLNNLESLQGGMIIPVRDVRDRIVALKVRRKKKPKYLYATDRDWETIPGTLQI